MFELYADIAVRLPLAQSFTYLVPPSMVEHLQPGMRVLVVFNRREEEGIVLALHRNPPDREILEIQKQIDSEPVLGAYQLLLARWMADYYMAGIGECIFKMFPPGRRYPKRGIIQPPGVFELHAPPRHVLNEAQAKVYEAIVRDMDQIQPRSAAGGANRGAPVHLIQGVTGSGKTEIYIHLIIENLRRGRGAILLVPEISLTVQLIQRLYEVFGNELAILHSALTGSARFGSHMSLMRGEKRIAVGTRSAVFAAVRDPGIIIVDEEHDGSYKEHSAPRYDARQMAHRRAADQGAVLVLGSATPRIETFYRASRPSMDINFRYALHRIEARATGARLPGVEIIETGPPDIPLTGRLLNEIDRNVKQGEQSLILLNRRGYSPYLYCPSCKEPVACPSCSVSLTLHGNGKLLCHYCGYATQNSGSCPTCGGPVRKMGSGTQKLEEYLLNLYPELRLERLDTDSAGDNEAVVDTINRLITGDIDILVGTQMIAKGIDAPMVTLVGVLQADQNLNMPDFRAAERTFALLTQVAGRSGRSVREGRVVFEAINPEQPVLLQAARQDYDTFYGEEIRSRLETFYPPFSRLVRLLFRAESEDDARDAADELASALRSSLPETQNGNTEAQSKSARNREGRTQVLGPAPAPLTRLNNQFRYHIIIKTTAIKDVRAALKQILPDARRRATKAYLEVDFDPVDLL